MSKINILAISPDVHGVGKYRIMDPYKFLGENHMDEVHVDISFNVDNNDLAFGLYDVVVFHTFIHQLSHEENVARVKWLKANGIKVVMDIDDLWYVDFRHPLYYQIKENKISEKKYELLKLADYVTTTTTIFQNTIRKKIGTQEVFVFPNAVNENEPQFKSMPIKSDLIRFGWLGGSSHLTDIELLEGSMSTVMNQNKGKIQYVLCGFDLRGTITEFDQATGQVVKRPIQPLETVWHKYESVFTDKYRCLDEDYRKYLLTFAETPYDDINKPYVRRWTKEITSYAMNYNYFDVSLAPLVESEFNANKSQLKVIESGFHKKALIASEVKPYTLDLLTAVNEGKFNDKGNALLVPPIKNHKEWIKHMNRLIANPNMIEDMGNRLYETVKDKYSLKNVTKQRLEFFKTIINK